MTPDAVEEQTGARHANRQRVRTKLLDAAEELFADRGYFGVSVRDITDHAGTRVAAVTDYFGGKDNLFREVLLRRIRPINEDRLNRLALVADGHVPAERIRNLIHAFAGPMLDRVTDGPGWGHYFSFIAQLANSGQSVQLLVVDEYNSVADQFVDKLRQLRPHASDSAIHDAYLLMVASTLQVFADTMRLDSITTGRLHSADIHQRYASLIDFVQGGIDRLTAPTT